MDSQGYDSPEFDLRTAHKAKLPEALAVDPKGNIRTLRYHANIADGLLDVELIMHPTMRGRCVGIGEVRLKPGARREGWSMLRDLYEAEGRMKDWESYLYWKNKVDATGSRQEIDPRLLPDEVIRRRSFREEEIHFEMPLPEREQERLATVAGEIDTKPAEKPTKEKKQ